MAYVRGYGLPLMSLRRDTAWNLAGSGVPLFAGVALIPFVLEKLGNEAFGVLTLIWGLIGYFSLFDLGVGRALTYQLARLSVAGEDRQISPVLQAGLLLTGAAGVLGTVLVGAFAPESAMKWLKIAPALQDETRQAFLIAALGIVPTTLTSGLRGALEGLDRFLASNLGRMVLGTGMFVLPAVSIWVHGPNLIAISGYLVLGRILILGMMVIQLRQFLFCKAAFRLQHFKGLWSYGFWVTVTGIVGPLMVYGDRFLVGAAVGADQLPLYAIPQEGLLRLLMIPAALTGALLPRLAAMREDDVSSTYRLTYRRVALSMLGVCAVAVILAYPVLSIWISSTFAHEALPIVWILCIGIWFNSIASVPYVVLQARGNPRLTALFHLSEMVLYIAVFWILALNFGLIGAALAWLFRVVLDWLLLHYSVQRLYLAN